MEQEDGLDLKAVRKATCKIEHGKVATGWMCTQDGYILTVGHVILGKDHKITEKNNCTVNIMFDDKLSRIGRVIFSIKGSKMCQDVALIKIDSDGSIPFIKMDMPSCLKEYRHEKIYVYGHGDKDTDPTPAFGEVTSPVGNGEDAMLQIDCPNAVQKGMSGAAVYSETLKKVIGIQKRAGTAAEKALSKVIKAMPMFTILSILEKEIPDVYREIKEKNQRGLLACNEVLEKIQKLYPNKSELYDFAEEVIKNKMNEFVCTEKVMSDMESDYMMTKILLDYSMEALNSKDLIEWDFRYLCDAINLLKKSENPDDKMISECRKLAVKFYRGQGNELMAELMS